MPVRVRYNGKWVPAKMEETNYNRYFTFMENGKPKTVTEDQITTWEPTQ